VGVKGERGRVRRREYGKELVAENRRRGLGLGDKF